MTGFNPRRKVSVPAPHRRPPSGDIPVTASWEEFRAGLLAAGFSEEWAQRRWDELAQPKTTVMAEPSPGLVVNVVEYLAGIPEEIPWIIGGVLFDHGVTLVAGLPKAGKSTLVTEWLRCLETPGAAFLDRAVAQRPTLLVTEESGVPVGYKVRGLSVLDIYDHRAAAGESFEHTLTKIGNWIAEHQGGVVVIDTFAVWALVDDENDASQVTRALRAINLLAATEECAVILVHHQRKGGGSHGEGVRGSGALVASVDIVIEVGRQENGGLTERTLSLMGRVLNPDRLLVDFDPVTRRYSEIDESLIFLAELEEWLAPIPPDGSGLTKIELGETWGIKDPDRRIKTLVNKGKLRVDPSGKAHRFWRIPDAVGASRPWIDMGDGGE